MTEEQKKIQYLIDLFDADDDYRDFKTGDEYYIFCENRRKELCAQEAEKRKDKVFELAFHKNVDIKKWISAFDSYANILDSGSKNTYKLFVELFEENKIPVEVQFPLFMNIYVHYPVEQGFNKYLLAAYDNYPIMKKENARKDIYKMIKQHKDSNGYFKVYRGEFVDAEYGSSIEIGQAISFTFNYEKARFFACRWSPKKANIYTVKVTMEDIIYYTNDRNEDEIVIRPENKGGKLYVVKCENLNPEEYYKGNTAAANEARLRMAIENGIAPEDYMKMHPEYFKKF